MLLVLCSVQADCPLNVLIASPAALPITGLLFPTHWHLVPSLKLLTCLWPHIHPECSVEPVRSITLNPRRYLCVSTSSSRRQ